MAKSFEKIVGSLGKMVTELEAFGAAKLEEAARCSEQITALTQREKDAMEASNKAAVVGEKVKELISLPS